MTRLIATFFYTGYLKPFSGTWGSAAGVIAAFLLFLLGGWVLVALLTPVAFGLGWWATAVETAGKENHDPSEVVIDEVAGQWIALLPVLIGATHAGLTGPNVLELWPGWLTAFFAFRFFDILKPGPIGWADRQHGPLGVMLDDIFAGIAAAITVGLAAYVYHGILGA
ncbi:phosphatidylglycerophosphatase A [Alisedimentitalea sp. MJ-SS2]|uniref:phosphatidylglycerophosphatase A family protein n=1 Tax=Aliisedimentitalea sp. MJ-SS2 TaxID=3049795 RepID=UPI0029115112|nr:phosphatidylglycerophosphatase A [Alisedimentitalea sp. MJ-SS2]MDU8929690.1 phosphatidylglycerophosphatase A [Alisedimentitalea sp. MJ-SS2]